MDERVVQEYQQQGEKRRSRHRGQKFLRRFLLFAAFCFLLFSLYSIFNIARDYFMDIGLVEPISWERAVLLESYTIQQEKVVLSDWDGTLIPGVNEGERVSKGVNLGTVISNTSSEEEEEVQRGYQNIYTPSAGIVFYSTDGLELVEKKSEYKELTIEFLTEKIQEYESLEKDQKTPTDISYVNDFDTPPKTISMGEPLYKITDNLSPCYLYLKNSTKVYLDFQVEDKINLRMKSGESYVTGKAKIVELSEEEGVQIFLVNLISGLEPLRHTRKGEVEIVIDTSDVVTCDPGAYVEKGGKPGIYTYSNKTITWMPIEVLERSDERLVFTGIESGTTIICQPWFVRDGLKINLGS